MSYITKSLSEQNIPQSEPLNKKQVKNSAGGFVFKTDDWQRLQRFLIIGSEGGSYYIKERELTRQNAEVVERCIAQDASRVLKEVLAVSVAGRAPKNDPALFALALLVACDNPVVRREALKAVPQIARTGTHLFTFLQMVSELKIRGWGRSMRRAISDWYLEKSNDSLAYQLVKYRNRNGWSHRDVLRLAHPQSNDTVKNALLKYVVSQETVVPETAPKVLAGYELAKKATTAKEVASIIRINNLPREAVPTQFLTDNLVWEALLENMPMTALIRNLGNLGKCGLLVDGNWKVIEKVCNQITDRDHLRKARVHPIAILIALKTYESGRGFRGSGSWPVVQKVVDALDDAFYASFDFVEATGKRFVIGADVSGSMGSTINDSNLTSAEAGAALAMVLMRVEPYCVMRGFSTTFVDLGISSHMRLDAAARRAVMANWGDTDCSVPMEWALKNGIEADVFVVITDSETWAGRSHPAAALRNYRQKTGINAKLIVLATESNGFSIADPDDPGMLDIAGFDTSVPTVINEFARL